MPAILSCTMPQTVAPNNPPKYHKKGLFSRRHTLTSFCNSHYHLGINKNAGDSNFFLYMGPDSRLIGPKYLYTTYIRLHGLFSWRYIWINLFAMGKLQLGINYNADDNNCSLYMCPDSSLKGPFSQKYIYKDQSFCNVLIMPLNKSVCYGYITL